MGANIISTVVEIVGGVEKKDACMVTKMASKMY